MGYEIISPTNINNKPNTALGVDFTFGYNGVFKSLYTTIDQAYANLKHLILTQRGERYYHPDFGCDLISFIFQPSISELKQDLDEIISSSINKWLPYITIESIDINTVEDDPNLETTVTITLKTSVNSIELQPIVIFVNEQGIVTLK